MARKIKSGIYQIINIKNGKRYFGASKRVHSRIKNHKNKLKKGTHFNVHLQSAWNNDRSENFQFSIVEYCPENIRFIREEMYLKTYLNCNRWSELYNFEKFPTKGPSYNIKGEDHHWYGKNTLPKLLKKCL